jgi:hypothetical protein
MAKPLPEVAVMITVNLWRPVHKGSLRGFATVTLPSGLILHDVSIHISHSKPWASPPFKPRLDQNKRQITLDSKLQWDPVVTFRNKEVRDNWSRQIIEALLRAHPGALSDDDAAE